MACRSEVPGGGVVRDALPPEGEIMETETKGKIVIYSGMTFEQAVALLEAEARRAEAKQP